MSDQIWRQIEALVAGAKSSVLLVAPFIKASIFEATLIAIPASVTDITCITRWSAEEIAAGVSDPEIMGIALSDGRPTIRLCHRLHAKVYVRDTHCLVGSANLTGKATGKSEPANMELLIEAETTHPTIAAFLRHAAQESTLATAEIAAAVRARADLLSTNGLLPLRAASAGDDRGRWYPVTRAPERLYRIYLGEAAGCTHAVLEGCLTDLAHLDLPPGLSESEFNAAVLSEIYAFPEVATLMHYDRISGADLEAELLAAGAGSAVDAAERALTLTRWLVHFDVNVHTVPAGPYDIVRGRRLA